MRFSTISLIALSALSTSVTAKWFGYCLDNNDKGFLTIYRDDKGAKACQNIVNSSYGKQCKDCYWREGRQCYSPSGSIDAGVWDKECRYQTPYADGSSTSD
ncbi:hypothetical protein HYFRA_00007121 [Hymenoscyphus fraxineus]|uniref:Uncharacterized protein n=1 Tax=Hymenoscyphus fraxineus TaxID=746836 RepID=A0A9N9KWF0_9HELO|nr:hypothetical protein HYFRA_00007121 [Hymenoscyphus fraxineus]